MSRSTGLSASDSGVVRCRIDHTAAGEGAVELRVLERQLEAWDISEVPAVLAEVESAAQGGWYAAGFVAYEAAPAFDRAFSVPSVQSSEVAPKLPLAWFGVFAECHAARELPCPDVPCPDLPRSDVPWPDLPCPALPCPAGTPTWSCDIDAAAHAEAIHAIREAIADGDAYVVNYTTRFRRQLSVVDDPFLLYRQLVAGHASGYHAYIETPDWAVACGSPELFFHLSPPVLTTRPMKGTAPRGRWSDEDVRQAEALQTSRKERSENVMVVDMLRNDVGRIAVPGTVAVPELWHVERHPTLWQLTSTVTAKTKPGTGLVDVFTALFPCGSVTGAPKVSAMSIITDLERVPRGLYCGAIGLVQPGTEPHRVTARFAVAIRTAVVDKTRRIVEYGSGGGITWHSSPELEWQEILVKTKALSGKSPLAGHGLLETMLFDPDLDGGSIRNFGGHLSRLESSAAYFGVPLPPGLASRVREAVSGLTILTRVRLVLDANAALEVKTSPLDDGVAGHVQRLCVDPEPVDSGDVKLFHKTTDRRRYDERARRHPQADDAVLVNERGEVTETTRASLAVLLDGQWCTPPLDCGLLPGVERARLLASGDLVERVVTPDELRGAAEVATLSSLRGWRPASVSESCECRA